MTVEKKERQATGRRKDVVRTGPRGNQVQRKEDEEVVWPGIIEAESPETFIQIPTAVSILPLTSRTRAIYAMQEAKVPKSRGHLGDTYTIR